VLANDPLRRSVEILLWMTVPVVAGYAAWAAVLRRRPDGDRWAGAAARGLGQLAMLGAASPLALILFWAASIPAGRAFLLPLVGLFVHAFGGATAWAISRMSRADRPTQGVYFLAGASSNVLTFGGIVVVLLLRTSADPHAERALAEMALYRIFEAPFYFLCAWPIAASLAATEGSKEGFFRRGFRPITLVPMLGIAAGWALNLAGVRRPPALEGVSALLVKINVVLMGLTVGLTLRRAAPRKHLAAGLRMSSVKFLIVPLVSALLAWLLGFSGVTLQVVAVCAAMPVAFMAVIASNLLHLDQELTGSLWLLTTLGMLAVVPLLALGLPLLTK
jgi:predicted permease